uniref:Cysteine-rich with EGF-like domains 2 n=1 Tax=Tetraodon nigroviridis TaxID=99883 RepID=H3CMS9_TETNG
SELRPLQLLSYLTVFLLVTLTDAKRDLKSACLTCQQITENFNKGFERTAKQNFGGGNTAWEERKLSKYETSEIRLMEIVEGLCESSSFECNHMVEEHEEQLETWWFKRKTKHPDLHKWFCIETIKVCCPKGTFGRDCNSCVGGSERPCHGNGVCDGDGTRGGDGKCSCNHGYTGEFCLDCTDGHFSAARNDTFSLCTECHTSCKTCTGATNQDCHECKEGWREDDQEACVDVDECSGEPSPCREDQYCLNADGSYSCRACDNVCSGCTGAGADRCQSCAGGYHRSEGTCADVDECSQSDPVCTEDNQKCINTHGSYMCVCTGGYEEKDGKCVHTVPPVEEENSEASEVTSDPHGEL